MCHLFHIVLVLAVPVANLCQAFKFSSQCAAFCLCDVCNSDLTVQCSRPQSTNTFILPASTSIHELGWTRRLLMSGAYLFSFPLNLCDYASSLIALDLSSNFINSAVSATTFNCLRQLQLLNASSNQIQTLDETAFDFLGQLRVLDLLLENELATPEQIRLLLPEFPTSQAPR